MFLAQTARQNRRGGSPPLTVCDDGGYIEPSGTGIPVCGQVIGQASGQECLF